MKFKVDVWNIKVTTVESLDKECDGKICQGCEAPCCKGKLFVLLTEKEFFSGKYPMRFLNIPGLKKDFPNTENVIGLAMGKDKCFFLKNNRCTIYEDRPKACRIYDCRKDVRPEIKEFVKRRFG